MEASASSGFDLFGVDAVTIEIAIFATAIVFLIRRKRKLAVKDARAQMIVDFLNASVIYPFVVLFFSVFHKGKDINFEGSKLLIALASVVGLVFVIGELIKSCTKL